MSKPFRKTCKVPGCSLFPVLNGHCQSHIKEGDQEANQRLEQEHKRQARLLSMPPRKFPKPPVKPVNKFCAAQGCENLAESSWGLCRGHENQRRYRQQTLRKLRSKEK